MVGGYTDNNVGAAWVFTRSGTTWIQQGDKLIGTGAVGPQKNQGNSVSLSADGNTALVCGDRDSSLTGAAYIFTRSGRTRNPQIPHNPILKGCHHLLCFQSLMNRLQM